MREQDPLDLYFVPGFHGYSVWFFDIMEKQNGAVNLSPWSLLLAGEEGVERDVGDLDDLEPDSGDITDGVTFTTESSDQDLVVLLHEVQATILGHEGRDLLSVLDQLDTDALADGRVRLLSLDTDLLEDDSLGVRGSSEGIGLPPGAKMGLLVVLIGPHLVAPIVDVFTGGLDT